VTPEEIVAFSEALSRIAASGGGTKALAAHLAATARGGVLLEDSQRRRLTNAGDERATREPAQTQRVVSGERTVGWLSLFGDECAPGSELLLRLTAAAIGIEMARNGLPARDRARSFWEDLLAERLHDGAHAREEASARGVALASHYVAVALECENGDETQPAGRGELRELAAAAFRSAGADLGLVEHGDALIVCVPAERAVDAANAKTAAGLLPKSAARRKVPLRVCGGVGTVVVALGLPASARAALAALAIGRRVYGSGRVTLYDELGAYRVLHEGADVDRLRAFASEVLAPLRAYDETHQTELERTLKLYFEAGQNVKTAAAELCVHRHTVFYRLRQIGEIAARSFDSPHDQLTLRLAVAIDELHSV
jgi:sugar diacid utilization regulator